MVGIIAVCAPFLFGASRLFPKAGCFKKILIIGIIIKKKTHHPKKAPTVPRPLHGMNRSEAKTRGAGTMAGRPGGGRRCRCRGAPGCRGARRGAAGGPGRAEERSPAAGRRVPIVAGNNAIVLGDGRRGRGSALAVTRARGRDGDFDAGSLAGRCAAAGGARLAPGGSCRGRGHAPAVKNRGVRRLPPPALLRWRRPDALLP